MTVLADKVIAYRYNPRVFKCYPGGCTGGGIGSIFGADAVRG